MFYTRNVCSQLLKTSAMRLLHPVHTKYYFLQALKMSNTHARMTMKRSLAGPTEHLKGDWNICTYQYILCSKTVTTE